ncbi:MAG TPA: glycosyltransferase family 4 protein [Syntrophales bacterium]|nr:glycosyltransferase family 4 protein [Syntrophales bacterium]
MNIKILFVIDGLEFGGGERCFAQIISALPTERYEIFLASAGNPCLYDEIQNTRVHLVPLDFSHKYNPALFTRLARIIMAEGIDIVHGQGARAEFYARLASGLAKTSKYISTIAMPVEGYDVGKFQKRDYRFLDRFSERYVDRFIVVSDSLKERMIRQHAIPSEKIARIYNGIEIDFYNPDEQENRRAKIREELYLDDDVLLVGSIGRLVWQKGFEYFLQCIPNVIGISSRIKFLLVGEGPLRRPLEDLSKGLGIEQFIIFTGQRKDIRDVLAALDILVIPSVLEGFPMITLEAMAMGKPIIATRIDGITEQIRDGKEGFLVASRSPAELTQAIVKVAGDSLLADRLGNSARQRVATEFSVQQMIGATIKVYEELS